MSSHTLRNYIEYLEDEINQCLISEDWGDNKDEVENALYTVSEIKSKIDDIERENNELKEKLEKFEEIMDSLQEVKDALEENIDSIANTVY
ncbi:MAG: hypothetical protein KC414_07210 [Romboutsia sp.]|nr:hypothetical protein [Romboutsia sp.]